MASEEKAEGRPTPEDAQLDSQVKEQTSLKDGEWYGLAEKMRLPEGECWFFALAWKGVLLCSQHCAARLCLGSLNLAPSLSTNRGQIQETFCSKTINALVKGSTQRNFPQIHQTFPSVPLDKSKFSAYRYPARLKEQNPIGQGQLQ